MSLPFLRPAALGPWPAAGPQAPAVWLLALDADDAVVAEAAGLLSPAELARACRGTPVVHRRRVLVRAALRVLLGQRLGLSPAAVELRVTPNGRPETADPTELDVSCSASGDVGVVAVAEGARVGIDVERLAPWDAAVLQERWLAPAEQAALAALPPAQRADAVTRTWTQKEAVLKGAGTGLGGGLARVVTTPGQAAGTVAGWDVRSVAVPSGCVASVATAPWSWGEPAGCIDSGHPDPERNSHP
jgi:4'-phosphopantetheinyl transferase